MLDSVSTQVFWNRIISVVDEAATGLIRTSYSSVVRDFHDFTCGLFDRDGNLLAHSVKTTTAFIGAMPYIMKNFLSHFDTSELRPGDALVTNDPWLATGQTYDICIASPIFHKSRLVGFAICIVHHIDIGGRMATTESREMYEEGLKLPMLKLQREGQMDPAIEAIVRANVRMADKVMGDIRAQLTANNVCARGLVTMMEDYGIDESVLRELATEITSRSEASLRQKIAAIPNGRYENEVELPPIGSSENILIKVAVIVADDRITVDYTGSSGQVAAAVNVTFNMTRSYSLYPIKLALDPDVPNNEGCLRPITVIAPEGTLLNCRPPAPTWGRTLICHNLPEIIFGALVKAIPDRVVAASGSTPIVFTYLRTRTKEGRDHIGLTASMGGLGASSFADGPSCRGFPFNVGNIPLETIESELPIIYDRKELLPDSGGAGRHRGGLGQIVEFSVADNHLKPDAPLLCGIRGSMRTPDGPFAVVGRVGGLPGRGADLTLNGAPMLMGPQRELKAGDRVRISLPGGGGYGNPKERSREAIRADIVAGYISLQAANKDYGADMQVDPAARELAET